MASSREDCQESMENNRESSFLQKVCNFEENSASMLRVGDISEGNQKVIDSLSEEGPNSGSISGSLAGKCGNSGEMLIDTDAELSPAKEAQEIGGSGPLKKLECSDIQPDAEIESDQEMGFASGVGVVTVSVGNQEMIDSLSDNGSFCGSISGSLPEKCGKSVEMLIDKLSPAKETQEIGEAGRVKKLESPVLQPDCEIVANQEMGFASAGNQEKIGSFCEKCPISGSGPGIVVSSGNEEQETMETSKKISDQELGLRADPSIGSISEGNQEMADSLGENASLSGFSAVKVATFGYPVHGANPNQMGFADDVKSEMGVSAIGIEGGTLLRGSFGNSSKGIDGGKVLVNPSLKIEVIDDTALIETFPLRKTGNVGVKKMGVATAAAAAAKNAEKKAKSLRRKAVYVRKVSQSAAKKKYSREEIEGLRFVNIVEQRKLWRDVHTGLGAAVMKEYHDLAASSKQQMSANVNVDARQRFRRVEGAPPPGVLGVFDGRGTRKDLNVFVPRGMARCNLQRTNWRYVDCSL